MLPSDTSIEANQIQIDLLKKKTTSQRLQLALNLSQSVIDLSKRAIYRANTRMSPLELTLKFIELHYGKDLAIKVRQHIESM